MKRSRRALTIFTSISPTATRLSPTLCRLSLNEHIQQINQTTVADITERFQAWFRQAISGASVDELIAEVAKLCNLVPFETFRVTGRDAKLFRGRTAPDDSYFENVKQLWYPPASAIATMGRANRVGAPILYLCQDGRTAMFETCLKDDQHVAITEINLADDATLNLQHVGVLNNLSAGNLTEIAERQIDRLKENGYTDAGITNVKMIHELLGEEFMRNVPAGNEQEYAISVAIAEFLLSYDGADGLMFPSKRSPNDYNIVVKPDAADEKLYVRRVYGLQARNTTATDIAFQYWKASSAIQSNGEIVWHDQTALPDLEWNSSGHDALQGPFKNDQAGRTET